jgi:hypothetical protein
MVVWYGYLEIEEFVVARGKDRKLLQIWGSFLVRVRKIETRE